MKNNIRFTQLHDSVLFSIKVMNGTSVAFGFELEDGSRRDIVVNDSQQLLCSDFLLGNIVLDCGFWRSTQCLNRAILPVSEYVDIDEILEKHKNAIVAGQIGVFYVSSSYGASLYCVGSEPVFREI